MVQALAALVLLALLAAEAGAAEPPQAPAAVLATAVDFTTALLADDAAKLRELLEPGQFQFGVDEHLAIIALQGRQPNHAEVTAPTVVGQRQQQVESISHWLGKGGPTWVVTVAWKQGERARRAEVWILIESGKVTGFTQAEEAGRTER